MSKIIPDGFYEGKLLDYGIRMTKTTNQPSVTAVFQVIHMDESHSIYWQGTFKGKDGGSNETTLKALVTMGLNDVNRVGDIAAQRASGLLDTDKIYNLKIQVEYNEQTQKSHNKVAFINEPGGGSLKDLVHPNDFKPMIGNLGIMGDLKRLIMDRNGGSIAKPNQPVANSSLDDIAF